jgi:hypothetical protein
MTPADQAEALLCPLCEYDLRGLEEPRCPECGYRFEWQELTDPKLRQHPYLFEHHRRHNLWSFFRTLIGGLRPRRFWSALYPTQPSHPWRLALYFVLVCSIIVVPAVTQLARDGYSLWRATENSRARLLKEVQRPINAAWLRRYPGRTPQQLVDMFQPPPTFKQLVTTVVTERPMTFVKLQLVPFAWPLLTLAAMMVFRWSMRRAKVRRVHAARCVIYSGDVLFWFSLVLPITLVVMSVAAPAGRAVDPWDAQKAIAIIAGAAWLVFTYRMIIALRLYLRFDHAIATVLATQVLTALTVAVLLVLIFNQTWWWLF